MRDTQIFAIVAALGLAGCVDAGIDDGQTDSVDQATESQSGQGQPDSAMLGIHWARDAAPTSNAGTSPNLTWHSGAIMTSAAVTAIYWGPSWTNSSYVGDKISGLDTLYGGVGGTTYASTNTEYTGTNGQVGTAISYTGHVIDTSASPRHAPKTSAIQAEVCKMISNPVANGYYPVYTDLPRGHAGYCAWHSYGTCNGVPVQFGFFFSLDNDPGCDVSAVGNHSVALDSLANVSGHELSEMMTDPRNGGWWDSSGAENADKCAWVFPNDGGQKIGGQSWQIQGNWSNNAYNNGTGYDTRDGQGPGCIDGSSQYP